MAENRLL